MNDDSNWISNIHKFIVTMLYAMHLLWLLFLLKFEWDIGSLGSSAGIVFRLQLGHDRGTRVQFLTLERYASFVQRVQTSSAAHRSSYSAGTTDYFAEDKGPGHEDDHLPPTNADVKKKRKKKPWNYTSIPPYTFMMWCLIKHMSNSTLNHLTSVAHVTKILIMLM